MKKTDRKVVSAWIWIILFVCFSGWLFLVVFSSFCKMYLSDILENKKITIYKNGQPEAYDIVTLYCVYDFDRRIITEGLMSEIILAMDPYEELEVKSFSFPVCVVACGKMELEVNLISREVKAGNEVAEELFALEGKQFFSCDF